MKSEVIIWGGTGNFKVLCELLATDHSVIGYFDNDPAQVGAHKTIPFLGGSAELPAWLKGRNGQLPHFIVSIGHAKGAIRLQVHEELKGHGMLPITAVHRTAFVAPDVELGEGSQVYAMAAVCVEARLGKGCIVNTRASVDHESVLEDGVTVGPGAVIAGLVHVEKYVDIYSGAVILPRLRIGEGAVVGAGAVVRTDVEPYTMVAGNPARVIRKIER